MAHLAKEVEKAVKGMEKAAFIRIDQYENKQGEVSKYLICTNIPHNVVVKNDLKRLEKAEKNPVIRNMLIDEFIDLFDGDIEKVTNSINQAFDQLLQSKRDSLAGVNQHAIAQAESYLKCNEAMKIHPELKNIYIFGYVVEKTVLVKGEYKKVKSRPLTLIKKRIEKLCCKTNKYRQFILENNLFGGKIDINGKVVTIH